MSLPRFALGTDKVGFFALSITLLAVGYELIREWNAVEAPDAQPSPTTG